MPDPETALTSSAFPCNPIPFALRVAELCKDGAGADDPRVRACIVLLWQMSAGQLATLDPLEQYRELAPTIGGAR